MSLRPWYEERPNVLGEELAALDEAGIPYELDEQLRDERGLICIRATVPVDQEEAVTCEAYFPDLYPYVRFEVVAPGLNLERHQHPFSENLCLIGRGTDHWEVDDTLAGFLTERLGDVLRAARSDDESEVAELEEHQGEPFSDYYPYVRPAMILVDAAWDVGGAARGELTLGLEHAGMPVVRAAVLDVRDGDGRRLGALEPALRALYTAKEIRGRWVRTSSHIALGDPEAFHRHVVEEFPHLATPCWERVGKGIRVEVTGVVFPEEVRWREESDGWVFLIRVEQRDASVSANRKANRPSRKRRRRAGNSEPDRAGVLDRQGAYFAPALRAGRQDLRERVPELTDLADATIAVVGTGGVGGPSVLEFARAGVGRLRMLDGDVVDPGIATRWPVGLPAAGHPKTEVMAGFIRQQYPYTEVTSIYHRLGQVRRGDTPGASDLDVLERLYEGADLVYDATAERGISYLLADHARDAGIPLIVVSATYGAWGGLVARLRPDCDAGCWLCFRHAVDDGTIPLPPEDPTGRFQPTGCADPTFTGAGFDVATVALQGVRLAVSTLATGEGAYPSTSWDVLTLSLRDPDGTPVTRTLGTWPLHPHPSCPRCAPRNA